MQAVYIDTRSRHITAHAVWVTKADEEGKGLVIREAAALPGIPHSPDLFLIDQTGYSAQLSNGFVTVNPPQYMPTLEIWGELMGSSLRPVPSRKVYAITGGKYSKIRTHQNLNSDVADTAYDMLIDYYKYEPDSVLVLEGQSDMTTAFVIKGEAQSCLPGLSEEHRSDIINRITSKASKVMADFYMEYYGSSGSQDNKHNVLMSRCVAQLLGGHSGLEEDREVLEEVIKRLAHKGATPGELEFYFDLNENGNIDDEISKKATDLIENLCTVQFVEAYHEDSDHEDSDGKKFTWAVPDDLVDQIQLGDTLLVDTYHGEATAIVSRVFRGSSEHNHRYVIGKTTAE